MNTTTSALAKYIQANPDKTIFEFVKGKENVENKFTPSYLKTITINGKEYKNLKVKSGDETLIYPVRKSEFPGRQFVSGSKGTPPMSIINKKIEEDFNSELECFFVGCDDGRTTTKLKLKIPVDVIDETNKNKIIKTKKLEDLDKIFSGCSTFGYIASNPVIYENGVGAYINWKPEQLIKKENAVSDNVNIEFLEVL